MNWGTVLATGCLAAFLAMIAREELISSSSADIVAKFPGNMMDLRDVKAPRLSGMPLRLFALATRMPVVGALLCKFLKRNNKFVEVRELATIVPDMPFYYPLHVPTQDEMEQHTKLASGFSIDKLRFEALDANAFTFKRWTIQDYTDMYKSGQTTPLKVAHAVLTAIDDSNSRSVPLRAVLRSKKNEVLKEAKASTARYAAGTPSGILDGVPVLIKDEELLYIYTIYVKGYETSDGTSFLGALNGPATNDALAVARLRRAGALIIGTTNMHEVGLGTTGINIAHGSTRNPYDENHMTGGSSSGSAAAVAAGLVPLALGTDGGGSIRIPAGLCGIVGMKATFMRIPSASSAAPSVFHIGPMTGSVQDAALAYAVLAGPDTSVPMSEVAPPVHLDPIQIESKNLRGLRVGIYPDYLRHTHGDVIAAFWNTVHHLEGLGATIVNVTIPHLQVTHMAHSITILTEITTASERYYHEHIHQYSPDVQINFHLARHSLTAMDFMAAQTIRGYATRMLRQVFESVDVLLTPTTGQPAPRLMPDVFEAGLSELETTVALMKYIILGNFVGIPGISVPMGYTAAEEDANLHASSSSSPLPISILAQAYHYNEHLAFHVARVVEKFAPPRKPKSFYYSILDDDAAATVL